MRSPWLGLALAAAGCFSESPSTGGCVDGEAACDCRPDATCEAGLECIASIDKCTPVGCTPGSNSCTCVDGDCLSGLVCEGGVCIPPTIATSGGDASVSGTTPTDTVADTTMGSETTPVTSTDPLTSDPTIPPLDTGETDLTGMSGSVSTDPTDATLETSMSDTSVGVCSGCIQLAGSAGCEAEYDACFGDDAVDGCAQLMECILEGGDTGECCGIADGGAASLWNALVTCAEQNTCLSDCGFLCA